MSAHSIRHLPLNFATMRVMVADDHDYTRTIIAEILRGAGVREIIGVSNGYEVLEELPRLQPKLLITDWAMDGMDGNELSRTIRRGAKKFRDMPIIIMGNRQDELAWWKEQKDANGYKTMSVSIAPGVSTLAFWVAQQILDGKEVPKDLIVPFLRIDQDTLEANLESTPVGGVANVEYSQEDAIKVIEGK